MWPVTWEAWFSSPRCLSSLGSCPPGQEPLAVLGAGGKGKSVSPQAQMPGALSNALGAWRWGRQFPSWTSGHGAWKLTMPGATLGSLSSKALVTDGEQDTKKVSKGPVQGDTTVANLSLESMPPTARGTVLPSDDPMVSLMFCQETGCEGIIKHFPSAGLQ